jgi:hypothetical protein
MLKNLDHTLKNFINNEYITNGLIVLCVLYLSFGLDNMSSELLKIFDNNIVRLLFLVLIAYITHNKPVVGILLAICYVLSVQHLNSTKVNGLPVEGYWSEHNDDDENNLPGVPGTEPDHAALMDRGDGYTGDEQMGDGHMGDGHQENFDDYQVCDSFTTPEELGDAQSNKLSGQQAQVQTWEKQLGPQGIGSDPIGQNMNDVGGPSPFSV